MEDYDFEEEYVYENPAEEQRFEVEYGAYARMEMERAKTVEEIAAEAGVSTTRQKGKLIKDLVFKFYVYVNAIAHRLIDEGSITNIKRDEVPTILEAIRNVPSPQYKNPEAFVLGYSVAKTGAINERQFNALVLKLPSLGTTTITPMDLLRYSNLWLTIKK